ncbi:TPA: hypothetical protein ACS8CD_002416 [Providencia alcalifaciens]
MYCDTKKITYFNQSEILDYIDEHLTDDFKHRLTTFSDIKKINSGICRGISYAFLMYENNNQGIKYIETMNNNFNTIKNINKNNTLHEKIENYLKPLNESIFNTLIFEGINGQIDYMKSAALNLISNKTNNFAIPKRKKDESDLSHIKNIIKKNPMENFILKGDIIISEQEIIDNIEYIYRKIANPNLEINDLLSHHPNLRYKIEKKIPLIDSETRVFLKLCYSFIAKNYAKKITERKLQSGLINNNTYIVQHPQNNILKGKERTLRELIYDIDRELNKKNTFYCLLSIIGHCTAISVKRNETNNKILYTYFDPNNGAISTYNKNDFFKDINSIIQSEKENGYTKKTPTGIPLVNITKVSQNEDSQYRFTLPEFAPNDIQNYIKSKLIEDKVKIDLPNGFKIQLKNHDPITHITQATIYGHYKQWDIHSTESDVKKMVSTITEKLPLIESKQGDAYIDVNGSVYSQKLKFSLKRVLKNALKFH